VGKTIALSWRGVVTRARPRRGRSATLPVSLRRRTRRSMVETFTPNYKATCCCLWSCISNAIAWPLWTSVSRGMITSVIATLLPVTEAALTTVGNHNRHIHSKTVRSRLCEFGLRPRRPYIGFPLTRARRAHHMAWLAAHGPRQFPMRQWRQVEPLPNLSLSRTQSSAKRSPGRRYSRRDEMDRRVRGIGMPRYYWPIKGCLVGRVG
jgi:hypothetical protein